MPKHPLRPYQQEAHDSIFQAWDDGHRNVGIVAATGAGKTHIFAGVVESWRQRSLGPERVLILAHRDELIRQAAGKVTDMLGPGVRVGLVAASDNQVAAPVIVGSVQTLRIPGRRKMVSDVGLIIVDECHHAAAESYRAIMAHYGALPGLEGPARALGVTATMMRSDRLQLGGIWPVVPFSITFSELVRLGYLVPPVAHRVRVSDLDLSKVKMSRGDYQDKDLGLALHDSLAPASVIRAYLKYAADRRALLFTPTVELAEEMARLFCDAGVPAACVHGKTPKLERRARIRSYQRGALRMLVNCGIFTEGTDLPSTGCVILMRPTKSRSLFIQIVGRGARVDPDNPNKKDFIFLDVCGATQYHTLSANIDLFGDPVQLRQTSEDEFEEDPEVEQGELELPLDTRRDGALSVERVDLLRPEGISWRQTRLGSWFLALPGGNYYALVPSPVPLMFDLFELGAHVGDSGMIASGLSQGDAMSTAESLLTPGIKRKLNERAGWRGTPPSKAQHSQLAAFGIPPQGITTAGHAADLINTQKASRRIDPCTIKRIQLIKRYASL